MRILCVIPVRGGSKGIPRKNLRPIAGKPLVACHIEQPLAAKEEVAGEHELRVVVSTDDAELADIAREYGAEVPFMRPAHLAEDTTATEPVVEHAIEFYHGKVLFEMHYEMLDFNTKADRLYWERLLSDTPTDFVEVNGLKVPTLAPTLNVLYTFLHLYLHLLSGSGVLLRD